MSSSLDKEYVNLIFSQLPHFKWIRGNLGNCRCIICGDSAKKESKRRCYIYQPVVNSALANHYSVKCHNCNAVMTFQAFLEKYFPSYYFEYKMALFKELGYSTKKLESPNKEPSAIKVKKNYELLDGCTPLSKLPPFNKSVVYASKRMIPKRHFDILWHTDNFKEMAMNFGGDDFSHNLPDNEARLVIPFIDQFGNIDCLQGRSLDPNSKMRYITIKRNEFATKVYGLDRIDFSKPILILESPINSLFIPNTVATADSNLLSYANGDIYWNDSQCRNIAICKQIEKQINLGKKVCLLPDGIFVDGKNDINDLVLAGYTIKEILEMVDKYTYSGLRAKLEFKHWRKI